MTCTCCLYLIFINFIWIRLPDESCRNCGGGLVENTKCFQCMKPTSMICKKCSNCTLEQLHFICTSSPNTKHPKTVSQIKSDNYPQVVMAWFNFRNFILRIITAQVLSIRKLDFDIYEANSCSFRHACHSFNACICFCSKSW